MANRDGAASPLHPEQVWSALSQIADINFSRDDFSVGPEVIGAFGDGVEPLPTTTRGLCAILQSATATSMR
jgi:hypothetical protein